MKVFSQGNWGSIELYEKYEEVLLGLDQCEYIIVIYHMHMSRGWHTPVRPPNSKKPFGLFASRSPNRPNPIGFAVIKLHEVTGNTMHVSGVYAFDGTPALDIKPWLPTVDCPAGRTPPEIETELGMDH